MVVFMEKSLFLEKMVAFGEKRLHSGNVVDFG